MSTATATSPRTASGRFIKVPEAAKRADVPPWRIHDLIRRGLLTSRRLPGSHPLVLADDVDRLLRECTVPASK